MTSKSLLVATFARSQSRVFGTMITGQSASSRSLSIASTVKSTELAQPAFSARKSPLAVMRLVPSIRVSWPSCSRNGDSDSFRSMAPCVIVTGFSNSPCGSAFSSSMAICPTMAFGTPSVTSLSQAFAPARTRRAALSTEMSWKSIR